MTKIMAALAAMLMLAAEPATVTGTWNMGLQGDHVVPVALVLKQDGKTVTGTILMPTSMIDSMNPAVALALAGQSTAPKQADGPAATSSRNDTK